MERGLIISKNTIIEGKEYDNLTYVIKYKVGTIKNYSKIIMQ
jgi:hypothetical protein